MSYVNNPSIPSFPASTQTEVKTAITNINNWIVSFNKNLGDTIGEYNGYGDDNYSSSLLAFIQKSATNDKVVYNLLKKLTGEIAEWHLTTELSSRINLIDDPDEGLVSKIEQINTISEDSGSVIAREFFNLRSVVTDEDTGLATKASIAELSTANTSLSSAVASAIVQTSTTLNGQTSTIETMAQSVDGINAQYTVKLNNNMKVAGFGLMLEEGEPSTFEILADKFAVVNTDGVSSTSPFFIQNDKTYINTALIQELSADKIAANGTIQSPTIEAGILNGTRGTFSGTLSAGVISTASFDSIIQIYNTHGTYNTVVPPFKSGWTAMKLKITIIGAGGGGSGAWSYGPYDGVAYHTYVYGNPVSYRRPSCIAGYGGGAGSKTIYTDIDVTPGQYIGIVVGAGGIGGIPYRFPDQSYTAPSSINGSNGLSTTVSVNGKKYVSTAGTGAHGANHLEQLQYFSLWDYFGQSVGSLGGGIGNMGTSGSGGSSDVGSGGQSYTASSASDVGKGNNGTGNGSGGAGGNTFYIDVTVNQYPAVISYVLNGYGGDGSDGYVKLEYYDPNTVVLNHRYSSLITWLDAKVGTVPEGAR